MLELQIVGTLAYVAIFLSVIVWLLVCIEVSKPVYNASEE